MHYAYKGKLMSFIKEEELKAYKESVKSRILDQIKKPGSIFEIFMKDNEHGREDDYVSTKTFYLKGVDLRLTIETIDEEDRGATGLPFDVVFEENCEWYSGIDVTVDDVLLSNARLIREEINFLRPNEVEFKFKMIEFNHENFDFSVIQELTSSIFYNLETGEINDAHRGVLGDTVFVKGLRGVSYSTTKPESSYYEGFIPNDVFGEFLESNLILCVMDGGRKQKLLDIFGYDYNDDFHSPLLSILDQLIRLDKKTVNNR